MFTSEESEEERKRIQDISIQRNFEKNYTQQAVEKETSVAFDNDEILLALNISFQKKICENYSLAITSASRNIFILCNNQIVKGTLVSWQEHLRKLSKADKHDWI